MKPNMKKALLEGISQNFRTFGGGKFTEGNPISFALAKGKLQFAAGVDVSAVIDYIESFPAKYKAALELELKNI